MPLQELLYKERYETVLNEAMQYSMEFDHLYQQADKAMYESKRTEGIIATFYDDIQIGYLKLKTCSKRLLAAGSFNIYISYISRKSKQPDFTFLICYLQMIHFDNSRFRSIYMLAAKVTHIANASIYQLQHINIVKAIVDIISPQTS